MEPDTMPVEAVAAVPEPAVVPEPPTGPLDAGALIAKALEQHVGIDTMERLLALRERLQAEQARGAFLRALAAFQGECPVILKTKSVTIRPAAGGGYSYRYAPLDIIVEQVRPYLQKYGLSYTIKTRQTDGTLTAICEAHHEGGHTEPSELTVPIDTAARMNDTQKVGAARTYAMRYAFCNAFGILTGDEDTDAVASDDLAPAFEAPRRRSTAPSPSPTPPPTPPAAPRQPSLARTLRASVAQAHAANAEAAPPADAPAAPADALSVARVKRLYALLHDAVDQADVPEGAHEEVFDRARDVLREWVAVHQGRQEIAHCSYKAYDLLCAAIPGAVEAALRAPVPPKTSARVVVRRPLVRRPAPRRVH
jgi:hypothetical protein